MFWLKPATRSLARPLLDFRDGCPVIAIALVARHRFALEASIASFSLHRETWSLPGRGGHRSSSQQGEDCDMLRTAKEAVAAAVVALKETQFHHES
jgi:hypothetical protein